MAGLALVGLALSALALLGVVILAGVVVDNGIVLIDAVTIVGNAAPVVPLPVAPGEIATGGARADALFTGLPVALLVRAGVEVAAS